MKLERWSWIAGIFAAVIGLLAWLVDKNDFIAFCKATWKFIITPFLSAYNWLTHPVALPVWMLPLLLLLGVLVAFLVWLVSSSRRKIRLHRRQAMTPNQPAVQPAGQSAEPVKPARIDWHDYIQDEIFDVLWQWRYSNNAINEYSLVSLCPRTGCMNRLQIVELDPANPSLHTSFMTMPATLTCHRCGFKRHFDYDGNTLRSRVCDEIERRVRTGEYEQRMTRVKS
jgi:hypothetical protein